MRTLVVIAVLTVLAGLGVLAYHVHDTASPIVVRIPAETSFSRALDVSGAPAVQALDARSLAEIKQHERSLIARARQSLQLQRDDMAQLHQAIDALPLDETTRRREHRELSARLRLVAHEIELAPTHGELTRILGELETARDMKRHQLAAAYRTTANALPPMHRSDALAKLAAQLR